MGDFLDKKNNEIQEEKDYLLKLIIELTGNNSKEFKSMLNKLSIKELYMITDILEEKEDNKLNVPDRIKKMPMFTIAETKGYSIAIFFKTLRDGGITYEDTLSILKQMLEGGRLV